MIKTVNQTTVAEIFSINNDKVYRIPKYQREYIWGIHDWDVLFNTILQIMIMVISLGHISV